jgi:hypothetical protein
MAWNGNFPSGVLHVLREYVEILPLLSMCKASRKDFKYYMNNWFIVDMEKYKGDRSGLKRIKATCLGQLDGIDRVFDLTFGNYFNQSVDNLPSSIKYLTFGDDFNQSVDKLPSSITYLKFGHIFNQSVDKLPLSIKYLKFGRDFNQPVNNLPPLTHLTFGDAFNQPVNNLPLSLTNLTFEHDFNQPVDKLPSSEN